MNAINVKIYMNKINAKYYSYSQINTFLNCPQKYKLIYINKIKKTEEGIEAFIGKVVHETLEWIYNNKIDYVIWDKIEEKYFKIWDNKWHNHIFYFNRNMLYEKNSYKYKKYNQEYFKKIGLEYLRNYYRINNGPNLNYDFTIGSEVELFTDINSFRFKVIIDRIDEINNVIYIHDYKTGKPKTKKDLKNDLQLAIYHIAIKQKFPNKEISLNWHFLKERDKNKHQVSILKSRDEIEKDIKKITKTVNEIIKNKTAKSDKLNFTAKTSFLCNWCYLWEHCYAKKEYNEKNYSINVI